MITVLSMGRNRYNHAIVDKEAKHLTNNKENIHLIVLIVHHKHNHREENGPDRYSKS